jgi:GntR family transcriptional regulator/MocR family aminotransferase
MWGRLFERHRRAGLSLQGQVRSMMVGAILDGHLPPGTALPSSRDLAEALGLARNTVVLAYQQLVAESYLLSRERSGHVVNPDILQGRVAAPPAAGPAAAARPSGAGPDWPARLRLRPTAQRNIVKPADWQRYPYPFLYGQYDPTLFPTAEWRECCLKALSVIDIRDWAQDLIGRDDESLVEQIRTRVLPRRGVWAAAEEIVITVGAQHALYMVGDLLMSPDVTLAVEDPCYPDARNIFGARTSRVLPVPVDAHGLPADAVPPGCDYVYVTPSHQCPTTVTMPLARRTALLQRAQEQDFVIIEDDYESENSFHGGPSPALKSLDRSDRVIYVGSLSKSFAPGLRLGYIVAPAPLAAELRGLRRLMLRHSSAYVQRAFALFVSLGHHDAMMRRLAHAYRERAEALTGALARHLPQLQAMPVAGGASCWVRGPLHLDARALAQQAQALGVLIEPGDVFFAQPGVGHCFRLGYSAIEAGRIDAGIQALAQALKRPGSAAAPAAGTADFPPLALGPAPGSA